MKKDQRVPPFPQAPAFKQRGLGPNSAGQSGDTQGLPDDPQAGDESVEELIEEGQFFEAETVSAVENTPDADASEVRTRQVPEDDVPLEYDETEPPTSSRN